MGSLLWIHECLSGEEIGVDEAGEEDALKEGRRVVRVGGFQESRELRNREVGDFRWGEDLRKVGSEFLFEALFETRVGFVAGVKEAGVMSCDGGGNEVAERRGGDCVFGPGSGVIHFASDFIGVWIGCVFQVILKFVGKFSEVVPEAGEVAPLAGGVVAFAGGEHFGGKFGGPVCDFVEVTVLGLHSSAFFAGVALALIEIITERGQEKFPVLFPEAIALGISFGMGVEIHFGRFSWRTIENFVVKAQRVMVRPVIPQVVVVSGRDSMRRNCLRMPGQSRSALRRSRTAVVTMGGGGGQGTGFRKLGERGAG